MAPAGHLERRRNPRMTARWPAIVEIGHRALRTETMDVSTLGAKVRLRERLRPGTRARLHLMPAGEPPLEVEALVWRLDPDGVVLFFSSVSSGAAAAPERELTPLSL